MLTQQEEKIKALEESAKILNAKVDANNNNINEKLTILESVVSKKVDGVDNKCDLILKAISEGSAIPQGTSSPQ